MARAVVVGVDREHEVALRGQHTGSGKGDVGGKRSVVGTAQHNRRCRADIEVAARVNGHALGSVGGKADDVVVKTVVGVDVSVTVALILYPVARCAAAGHDQLAPRAVRVDLEMRVGGVVADHAFDLTARARTLRGSPRSYQQGVGSGEDQAVACSVDPDRLIGVARRNGIGIRGVGQACKCAHRTDDHVDPISAVSADLEFGIGGNIFDRAYAVGIAIFAAIGKAKGSGYV